MDVHSPSQRSFNMSKIHAKNTTPELKLRKALSTNGIRGYRLHYKLIGRPDIVFTKKKIAIFIDGCFWHKCKTHFIAPKTSKKFWYLKIKNNVLRDKNVNRGLKNDGWKVIRIWEHDLKENKGLERVTNKLLAINT